MMINDLVCARWQVQMGNDPTQDPHDVLEDAKNYWKDPAQAGEVCALIRHQGSLWYPNPTESLEFEWKVSMEEARTLCKNNGSEFK